MNARRWWDVAVVLVIAGLIFIGSLDLAGTASTVTLIALLVAIGVLYGVLLRRWVPLHIGSNEPDPPSAVALLGQLPLIALAAGAVFVNADMMNLLVIVLPLIWLSSPAARHAIIVNVVATAALGVGFAGNQGWAASGVMTAIAIAGISVVFSTALGLWISSIASWGNERARLLAELIEAQGALEVAHRESGAAAERGRLARDIHDTIAQSLTSIVMLAQRAAYEPHPGQTIALVEDTARDALSEARGLVAANAPADSTASATLEGSLTRLGERFDRETSVHVTTSIDLDAPLPRELEVLLLRCVQESLANVRKHAEAGTVSVMLLGTETTVELTVADDGNGLRGVTIDDERGFGLTGMRERVAHVSGHLSVQDASPSGVILTIAIPRAAAESAGESAGDTNTIGDAP